MAHQATCFSDAQSAWENWNLTEYDHREEVVSAFKNELAQHDPQWAKVMTFHLEHAQALLANPHHLPGPTGETNELCTAGRGVALLIGDEHSDSARVALIAQLTAALLAGNAVVLCSDDEEFISGLESAAAALPANLLQRQPHEAVSQLLECDIRALGFVGAADVARELNVSLSKRDGAIVSMTGETDLVALPLAHDPCLSLRFITERTRTINITAVGGNATLLELGSGGH